MAILLRRVSVLGGDLIVSRRPYRVGTTDGSRLLGRALQAV
jgi:hypothetical protein